MKIWVKLILKVKKINHHVLLIQILHTWLKASSHIFHSPQKNNSLTVNVLGSVFFSAIAYIIRNWLTPLRRLVSPKSIELMAQFWSKNHLGCWTTMKIQWSSLKAVMQENFLFLGGGLTFVLFWLTKWLDDTHPYCEGYSSLHSLPISM